MAVWRKFLTAWAIIGALLMCVCANAQPMMYQLMGKTAPAANAYELADTASAVPTRISDTIISATMDSLRAVTLIVVMVHDYPFTNGFAFTITDNYGNTYTAGVVASNVSRNGRAIMYYCANPTLSGSTVTVTYKTGTNTSTPVMFLQAWRGVASPILDATSTNYVLGGTQTTTSSGTLNPTVATAMGGSLWGGTIVANSNVQPTASGSMTTANQQQWRNYLLQWRYICAAYYKTNIGTGPFNTIHAHGTFGGPVQQTYAIGWAFR